VSTPAIWNGRFKCPEAGCSEEFAFVREQDGLEGLEDTFLAIAHIHDEEHPDGQWTGSVFRRRKGGKFPEGVKQLQLVVKEQRSAAMAAKRIDRASRGTARAGRPAPVQIPTPPPVKGQVIGTRVLEGRTYQVTRLEAASNNTQASVRGR